MNRDDDLATPRPGDADGRVQEVLRRGGVVEHDPPPRVWEGIMRSLPDARSLRAVGGGAAPTESAPRRRRWGSGPLLLAAAVGAAFTWVGIEILDRETPAELLVSGELAALTEDGTEGRAEVVEVNGQQRLRVELADRPDPGDGYLEVWLLRPDVSGMVTLGVLAGETGEFALPTGLDVGEFAVVDISREHVDGDPGHGGDSLIRGEVG